MQTCFKIMADYKQSQFILEKQGWLSIKEESN
jgi:hypothetical protein